MSSSRARPRGPAGLARPADLADAAGVWPRAVSAALPTSRRTDRTFASRRMGSCTHGSGEIPERLSVAPSRKETPCDCFDARQPFLRTASAVRAAPNRCLRGRADAPCVGSTCGRCARPRAWDRRRRREPQVEWPHLGGRGRGPHGRPLRASDAQDARRSFCSSRPPPSGAAWHVYLLGPAEPAVRRVRERPAYAAFARLCVSRWPDSSALRAVLSASPRFWPLPRRSEPSRFTSRAVTATPRACTA
jgi:hypothetical protein